MVPVPGFHPFPFPKLTQRLCTPKLADFVKLAAYGLFCIGAFGVGAAVVLFRTDCGVHDSLTRLTAASAPCASSLPALLDFLAVLLASYGLFFVLPSLHETYDTRVGLTEVLVEDYTVCV